MSQTTVAEQGVGFEGELLDLGNTDVISRLAEGVVPFGHFVVLGTDKDNQGKLPAVAGDLTDAKNHLGFSVRQHTIENPLSGNAGEYADKDNMSVNKKGRMKIKCETAFAPGDTVHVGFQNGEEGKVYNANSVDREPLATARFTNTGLAGEIAFLDLSIV